MSNFKRASQYGQGAPRASILSALQATTMLDTKASLPAGRCSSSWHLPAMLADAMLTTYRALQNSCPPY